MNGKARMIHCPGAVTNEPVRLGKASQQYKILPMQPLRRWQAPEVEVTTISFLAATINRVQARAEQQ
jgi:hypothetical protein